MSMIANNAQIIDTFYNCPKCNLKTVNVQQKISKKGSVTITVKKCSNKDCKEQTGLKQIIEHDKKQREL